MNDEVLETWNPPGSEHDETPVDVEWMKDVGFVVEPNPVFYSVQTPYYEVISWDSMMDTIVFGAEGDVLFARPTRGKIRTLYRLLGLNLGTR